jgi:peptide/nickel transport system permease protein
MTISNEAGPAVPTVAAAGPARKIWRDFAKSRVAVAGLIVLLVAVVCALLAPWIVPQDPYDLMQLDIMDGRLPPGSPVGAGFVSWLGTDDQGRDLLSGILYGLRISLLVGLVSVAIAGVIGSAVGLYSAFAGGYADAIIMRVVDIQLSFPAILIAMMIMALAGKGVTNVMIALLLVTWATFARTARASALAERKREYIEAAQGLGFSQARIILVHALPNCLPPLMVIAMILVARAITLEATLSFLGLGTPVTQPSLGLLIANGFKYLLSGEYWISFFPGVALLIVVLAINLVGDQLRDILNPRSSA